jgi:hypothetical protein
MPRGKIQNSFILICFVSKQQQEMEADIEKPEPGKAYNPNLYRLQRINPNKKSRKPAKPAGFRAYGFAPFAKSGAQVRRAREVREAASQRKSLFIEARRTEDGMTKAQAEAAWKDDAPNRKAQRVYKKTPSGRWQSVKGRYVKNAQGLRVRSDVPLDNINLRATGYDISALTGKRMGKDIAKYLSFLGPTSVKQFLEFDDAYYKTAARITPDEVADFVAYSVQPWEDSHKDLGGHWKDRFDPGNADFVRGALNRVQPYQTRIKKNERFVKQEWQ